MTIEQADNQAQELIRLIRQSKIKNIKIGELNIIDLDKFIDTHESRINFLETFSHNWKTHYYRLYLVKKKVVNEKM